MKPAQTDIQRHRRTLTNKPTELQTEFLLSLISGEEEEEECSFCFLRSAIFPKLFVVFFFKPTNFYFFNLKTAKKFPPFAQSAMKGRRRRRRRRSMFYFLISRRAVNRTSCDSVLILSCICGVTLLSVKIFWPPVPRPGLCDAS